MRVKIKKMVLGNEYIFRVEVFPNSYECTYRLQGTVNIYNGIICPNFKCISFKNPIVLEGYVNDYKNAPKKEVKGLKLSKENSLRVKEYIL